MLQPGRFYYELRFKSTAVFSEDSRTMRRVGSSRGFAIRGAFMPFNRAIRFAVATRPTARSGPATVVRDGVLSTEFSVLSKPTTATSCGTRTPESLACCMKPSATMSLKQITASVRSFDHASNARRPPTKSGESTEIVFIFGLIKCLIRPGCTVTLREIEIALVDATLNGSRQRACASAWHQPRIY
ncbi:Hypothetical protein [Corynebacterium glutamicum ATCC 13032]|uniref:Uncharacterized protein n=1 Tax=Corynebacterium glutamicum (strain ATCC 13032 / DSM 20300 / JCM 1318 / BCRC 11384 / CCUG 27702 / LMG 3730 / NBRC 12168 / NCIMB 10025 / NRRL B-2784 / 534) TaxID=196627 RepID=Q8NMT2_CORGL|nr:Hypothetical protein [Corynebacterium glutamicum ATCC 13032]